MRSTKEEKQRLLDELIEAERQIMYWEKKIEIQKEIQQTLDPEIGQDEVRKMKKEVHIMEQRLLELKRNHKRMVHEMEKSISKRDIILTKGKAALNKTNKGGATVSSLQGDITHLQRQLNKKKADARAAFSSIKELQKQTEEIAMEVTQMRQTIDKRQEGIEELRDSVKLLTLSKAKILGDKKRISDIHNLYSSLKKGSYVPRSKESNIERCLQLEMEKRDKVRAVITEMRSKFPHCDAMLDLVNNILVTK